MKIYVEFREFRGLLIDLSVIIKPVKTNSLQKTSRKNLLLAFLHC